MAQRRGSAFVGPIFDPPDDSFSSEGYSRESISQMLGEAEARTIPFMPWAMKVPVPGVGSLNFDLFPFQREWYSDEIVYRRRGTIMKSTQVGASEYMVRWAIFWPDTRGDTSLYVFPARVQLTAFSDQRVKGLIQGSTYLSSRVPYGYIDNKTMKQIGFNGYIHFRGSQKEADLESVAADEVVLDEYDLLMQKHIPAAQKRLSSPTSRNLLRRIGWPTYTDIGIHRHYLRSDRRQWFVKCKRCGERMPLHFYMQDDASTHFVDVKKAEIVCGNCEKPLDREAIRTGEWVAEYPDRDDFGYHVSRLMVPGANIPEIIEESKLTRTYEIETFWRKTLGLPYDTEEGRLSAAAIQAAISAGGNYYQGEWDSGYTGDKLVTAGVDVATTRALNVRISEHLGDGRKRALFIGEVPDFKRLVTMLVAFRVKCCCIDHLPDGRQARAVAHQLSGIVFVHSWADNRKQAIAVDQEMHEVTTHRTTIIDTAFDLIRQQKNLLPVNIPDDYIAHMRAPVRLVEEDDETGMMKVGYRVEAPHDYMQAEAYDVVATELWFALRISEELGAQPERPLDEIIPFERTTIQTYDDSDYSAGPDEYSPGPSDDDDDDWPLGPDGTGFSD